MLIKGIDIILYETIQSDTDPFGRPIFTETATTVSNVLIGEPSTDDVINEMQLSGKRIQYTLGIPKGDRHDWKDKKVSFFGRTFKTFGDEVQGIEELVPGPWSKKVKVELYE